MSVCKKASVKRELVSTVTTSAASYAFKNLEEGAVYCYRVKASDGDASSAYSDYAQVSLLATSIDEVIAENESVKVYTLSGVQVFGGKMSMLPALKSGIYIVKGNSVVKKVFIK